MVNVVTPGPSMLSFALISGRGLASVIVPLPPAPLKLIVFAGSPRAFASVIACRSDPEPVSSVFVTENVPAGAETAEQSSPIGVSRQHSNVRRIVMIPVSPQPTEFNARLDIPASAIPTTWIAQSTTRITDFDCHNPAARCKTHLDVHATPPAKPGRSTDSGRTDRFDSVLAWGRLRLGTFVNSERK